MSLKAARRHCRRSLTACTKVRVVPLPPMSGVFTESGPLLNTSSTAFCNLLPARLQPPQLSKNTILTCSRRMPQVLNVWVCGRAWVPVHLQQVPLALLPHIQGPTPASPSCAALPVSPETFPAPLDLLVVHAHFVSWYARASVYFGRRGWCEGNVPPVGGFDIGFLQHGGGFVIGLLQHVPMVGRMDVPPLHVQSARTARHENDPLYYSRTSYQHAHSLQNGCKTPRAGRAG